MGLVLTILPNSHVITFVLLNRTWNQPYFTSNWLHEWWPNSVSLWFSMSFLWCQTRLAMVYSQNHATLFLKLTLTWVASQAWHNLNWWLVNSSVKCVMEVDPRHGKAYTITLYTYTIIMYIEGWVIKVIILGLVILKVIASQCLWWPNTP